LTKNCQLRLVDLMKLHSMEKKYLDDTKVYLNREKRMAIVLELLHYAYFIYDRVYVFKNFDAYAESFRVEPKSDVYWNGLHYEKMIDHIRICTAFENYNKAVLLSKDILVHAADQNSNKTYYKQQKAGLPVLIDEFMKTNPFMQEEPYKAWYLSGLSPNFNTITFSQTLKPGYQELVALDPRFLGYLTNINIKRNRLHFYKNYSGAFEVNRHLDSILFAKTYGLEMIGRQINAIREVTTIS
jgi:hypothetical protein